MTVILGAGLTGLATAYFLKKAGESVTVLEASSRAGGWVRTIDVDGFLFELGPRSVRLDAKGEAVLKLGRELGLAIAPPSKEAQKRYILQGGRLRRPEHSLTFWTGCLHDLFAPRSQSSEETIDAFFTRRFGKRFAASYGDALAKGIFATSGHDLSLQACLPTLAEIEKRYRSLVFGMVRRPKVQREFPLFSFEQGMESLTKRLAEEIGSDLHLNTAAIRFVDGQLETSQGLLRPKHMISTLPESALAKMTGHPTAIETASIFVVSLAFEGDVIEQPGFGYLIPECEGEALLGVVFDSVIFPTQCSREGTRLTAMVKASCVTPVESALDALRRHLGIQKAPIATHLFKAESAIAQYRIGHVARVAQIKKELPFLAVGSSFDGLSVPDCIAAAKRISAIAV